MTNPLTEYYAELERARKEMTGDTEQQEPDDKFEVWLTGYWPLWRQATDTGQLYKLRQCWNAAMICALEERQAPGLDWDAASRKMIEQERHGTPLTDALFVQWYGKTARRPPSPVQPYGIHSVWHHADDLERQLAAAQAALQISELELEQRRRLDAEAAAELASSQHGYKLLADHVEKQALELADTRSLLVAAEQNLLRARQDQEGEARAAAAWADSVEKQAEEIAQLRARKWPDDLEAGFLHALEVAKIAGAPSKVLICMMAEWNMDRNPGSEHECFHCGVIRPHFAELVNEIAALKQRIACRFSHDEVDGLIAKATAALKQQLADMTEDYLRRHKDAADRSEEVLTLRIEIAALKQRLEQSEKRYQWCANELLASDYGDNDTPGQIGWIVYGWRTDPREMPHMSRPRIYGPTIDAAVDAALAAEPPKEKP